MTPDDLGYLRSMLSDVRDFLQRNLYPGENRPAGMMLYHLLDQGLLFLMETMDIAVPIVSAEFEKKGE
jgi:hypothetical protein